LMLRGTSFSFRGSTLNLIRFDFDGQRYKFKLPRLDFGLG
jgi:hypothetical protein